MKPIPRLSRALRAFSHLSKSTDNLDLAHHLAALQKKRQFNQQKSVHPVLLISTFILLTFSFFRVTWSSLAKYFEKKDKVLLNSLRQLAKKIVGDESSGKLVDECAIELFLFFLDKDGILISMKEVKELQKNYGAVDLSLAKEISKVSRNVTKGYISQNSL